MIHPTAFIALGAVVLGDVSLGRESAGVAFLAAQSAIGIFLLETINYFEHYGLHRRESAPGEYEPVAARHSWDSGYRLSNWSIFNLGRHADHHLHAGRRYRILRRPAKAAPLPTGYAGVFLLAMVPPLWRRVMDPRARAATLHEQ